MTLPAMFKEYPYELNSDIGILIYIKERDRNPF